MKLAKPLKAGGSPLTIVAEFLLCEVGMVEQLGRSVDRESSRAARSLASSPEHDKPRKKVVDVEGERVTYREASNGVCAKGECTLFPSGSVAVARMKRNCINLGDLHASFLEGRFDQLTEGGSRSMQESDSSIVVRDGRADHMAKGWAEWITEHSTQAEALLAPLKCLSRTLFNPTIHSTRCELLRVHSEEPCAGIPHAGICEGTAR